MCDRCAELRDLNPELAAKAEREIQILRILSIVPNVLMISAIVLFLVSLVVFLGYDATKEWMLTQTVIFFSLLGCALCVRCVYLGRLLAHAKGALEGLQKILSTVAMASKLGIPVSLGNKPKQEEEKIN
jgi:hypothetical protein